VRITDSTLKLSLHSTGILLFKYIKPNHVGGVCVEKAGLADKIGKHDLATNKPR
jgi:hypothetical protein